MPTASLRTATLAEIADLEALQRRASLVWADTRDQLQAHPDAIEIPPEQVRQSCVRVAVDEDDALLGFSVVLPPAEPDDPAQLDGLFVEPDHMRGGIGRLLVDDAEHRARAAGWPCLAVVANPNALGFYERLGFTAGDLVATRFGPAVPMMLTIGPI